jgi:hypothetical protein
VAADSGTVSYGVRVAADTATSVAFGANLSGDPPVLTWFFNVDSVGTPVTSSRVLAPTFNAYVFDPPAAALDSTLAVGGMPSARSLLRLPLPRALRDSTQIVRATLLLFPAAVAQGAPTDSFTLIAQAVAADLGGKSPLAGPRGIGDSSHFGLGTVLIGSSDTVRVDITDLLRRWAGDTTSHNALFLRSNAEGVILTEIRFEPSGHPLRRPLVRLTFVPRYPFGTP